MARAEVAAVEDDRHGWREGQREQKGQQPADGHADQVTIMIWMTDCQATTGLAVPMAFSTPIWETFCKIWIWKKPPITSMPMNRVKPPWVLRVLCWAEYPGHGLMAVLMVAASTPCSPAL